MIAMTAAWNVLAIEFPELTQQTVLVPGDKHEVALAPLHDEDATTAPAAGLEDARMLARSAPKEIVRDGPQRRSVHGRQSRVAPGACRLGV